MDFFIGDRMKIAPRFLITEITEIETILPIKLRKKVVLWGWYFKVLER